MNATAICAASAIGNGTTVGCVAAAYVDRPQPPFNAPTLDFLSQTQHKPQSIEYRQTAAKHSPPDRPNKLQTQSPACKPGGMDAGRLAGALSKLQPGKC